MQLNREMQREEKLGPDVDASTSERTVGGVFSAGVVITPPDTPRSRQSKTTAGPVCLHQPRFGARRDLCLMTAAVRGQVERRSNRQTSIGGPEQDYRATPDDSRALWTGNSDDYFPRKRGGLITVIRRVQLRQDLGRCEEQGEQQADPAK